MPTSYRDLMTAATAAAVARGDAPAPAPPRRTGWVAAVILIVAGGFAYANGLDGPFIFDDRPAIVENPSIRSLWPIHRALMAPPENPFGGRPIVNLSFAINYAISGDRVRGYHVTNVIIHVLTALVLFGVLRRTFRTPRLAPRFGANADGLALAAALLWEVHPLLTEAVTYTSTRTEGLMALFFLLTFYAFGRARESKHPRLWLAASVAASAIGMGCKEVMAAAPPLLYLFDALLLHDSLVRPLRRRPWFYAALAATVLIVPALLLTLVNFEAKTGQGFIHTTPVAYALTQTGVVTHYLRLAFWPQPLVLDYSDWPLARSWRDVWPYLLFIVALLLLSGWAVLRRRPIGFVGAWVFLVLAPTSSFIPLRTEVATERRMYLPLMAIVATSVLIVFAVLRGLRTKRIVGDAAARALAVLLTTSLAATLALATRWRNADYASDLLIWSDTVAKRPTNVRALRALGESLRVRGHLVAAREVYERCVAAGPTYPRNQLSLGELLIGERQFERAIEHIGYSIRLDPKVAQAHASLGLALAGRGDLDAAMRAYRSALALDPKHVDAHVYLADALAARGDPAAALLHLRTAARLAPGDTEIQQKHAAAERAAGR